MMLLIIAFVHRGGQRGGLEVPSFVGRHGGFGAIAGGRRYQGG